MNSFSLTTESTEDTEENTSTASEIEAHDIGRIQIETALSLYAENNLICAIILARSADEYLGKLLQYSANKQTSFHRLKSQIEEKFSEQDELNYISNNLKHFNPSFCEKKHNLRLDAIQLLCRCISNYVDMGLQISNPMKLFAEAHPPEMFNELPHNAINLTEKKSNSTDDINTLSGKVIDCAIQVHKQLGAGLLESAYQQGLAYMLSKHDISYEKEKEIPVKLDQHIISTAYRADFVIDGRVILEIKSVEKLAPIHEAQLLTYMKLGGFELGLLLNFNEVLLKNGIKRMRL